ncbi:MAG: glycosyltransferase family 4 protein [Parabacteroides sp.]|nr:glycosyltransferase family 4 protein [Parabacteroides sp.]
MYNILFVHPVNDLTGSCRVLANIIEMEYSNDTVFVITRNENGFLSQLPNVKICSVIYKIRGKKYFFSPLISRIHAFLLVLYYGKSFDTFYINTIVPFYAALVAKLYNKKIIYHIHEKFVSKRKSVSIYEWFFNHINSKRIFVSKYLESCYPIRKDCQSIIKYNTLPKSFLLNVHEEPLSERRLNRILMISSLNRIKGIFNFIELARILPEYNFTLILSASQVDISNYIKEKIPLNLDIIPAQSNIHPFLQKTDLILNLSIPSLWIETFGMTILEAMAYHIPAIVPNVGGPQELVKDNYNGFCIDVTNVEEVAQTIKKSLNRETYTILHTNTIERFKILNNNGI